MGIFFKRKKRNYFDGTKYFVEIIISENKTFIFFFFCLSNYYPSLRAKNYLMNKLSNVEDISREVTLNYISKYFQVTSLENYFKCKVIRNSPCRFFIYEKKNVYSKSDKPLIIEIIQILIQKLLPTCLNLRNSLVVKVRYLRCKKVCDRLP